MASVKIKLRSSSVPGKKGTIFYQLTHQCKIKQITTSMHLLPEDWDAEEQKVRSGVENGIMMQSRMNDDVALLKSIIDRLDATGEGYEVGDIVTRFKQSDSRQNVLSFMCAQVSRLKEANRLGTAQNYERTLRSFLHFLGDEDIPFGVITESLVESYSLYLKRRGILRNSISFYMRILRAVYNKAVRQHLVTQTFPFQNVYTGIDKTRKRAVNEDLIVELNNLDLPEGSALDFSRDLFIFSFCTRGMAFVDVAYLKKADIADGMISYARRKTNQWLCIHIESRVKKILEKYDTGKSPYVFPILKNDDADRDFKRYQYALNTHNRMLKKLSSMLSHPCTLTSYTPRHSWATIAHNQNVPISIISAGLGHNSERTTQIYLDMLENSRIDSANQKITKNLN